MLTAARQWKALPIGALIVMALGAAGAAEAQSACERLRDGDGLHLAGRIGGLDVRVHLFTGFPAREENGVSGAYLPASARDPADAVVDLEGTVGADCRLALVESTGPEAAWDLRLDADGASGTRTLPGAPATSITLRLAQPVDCSGAGPWRTFAKASWPVTFSYPLSWRLVAAGNALTLVCPDPAGLFWGGRGIHLTHDAGEDEIVTSDGRRGRRLGDFVTFSANRWLVGDERCEDPAADLPSIFCRPARHSTRRGMLVLQGMFGEDRGYGQGPGIVRHIFFLGRRWISLDSRDGPAGLDTSADDGPVVFDGDDVTARMLRSVKPR